MSLRAVSIFVAAILILVASVPAFSQVKGSGNNAGTSSPAFAEVLFRKTELLADAQALSDDYTDTNPKLVDLRHEVAGLDTFLARILATPPSDQTKLTIALGKLMVRRASLDTEFVRISRSLNPEHPDYKRAKKRLEIFDAAIKEILS